MSIFDKHEDSLVPREPDDDQTSRQLTFEEAQSIIINLRFRSILRDRIQQGLDNVTEPHIRLCHCGQIQMIKNNPQVRTMRCVECSAEVMDRDYPTFKTSLINYAVLGQFLIPKELEACKKLLLNGPA